MVELEHEVDEYSFRRVARLLHYGRTLEEIRKSFASMNDSDFLLVYTAGQMALEQKEGTP
jgi:hypothetical protein